MCNVHDKIPDNHLRTSQSAEERNAVRRAFEHLAFLREFFLRRRLTRNNGTKRGNSDVQSGTISYVTIV